MEIARDTAGFADNASGVVQLFDLLAAWRLVLGINANLPGTTVVGVILSVAFYLQAAGGATATVGWGLRTGPLTLDAADTGPGAFPDQDWMEYGLHRIRQTGPAAGPAQTYMPYRGEGSYHRVKAMRKIASVQETLWLAMEHTSTGAPATADLNYSASVVLKMP